jgi:uncharacterized membrane protein YkvI
MIIIMIIIIGVGIAKFFPDYLRLQSENYMNPNAPKWGITGATGTTPASFGNSLLWALTYAGFQLSTIGPLAASFEGARDYNEAKGSMVIGVVINAIMLAAICMLLISGMPEIYTDEAARTIPTLYMVQNLGIPAFGVIYPLLLFLALITTAVGFVFGCVTRFENLKILQKIKNVRLRNALIAVVTLFAIFLVSQLGLMWVIQVAYRYLGIYNWVIIVLPFTFLGWKNIKRLRKAEVAKEGTA